MSLDINITQQRSHQHHQLHQPPTNHQPTNTVAASIQQVTLRYLEMSMVSTNPLTLHINYNTATMKDGTRRKKAPKVNQRQQTDEERDEWEQQIRDMEKELKLKRRNKFPKGKMAGKAEQMGDGGTAYMKNDAQFQNFLWRANFVQAALIFQVVTLLNTPPCGEDPIILYTRMKSQELNMELLDLHGNPVFDRWGNVILCTGEWQCKFLLFILFFSIHAIGR